MRRRLILAVVLIGILSFFSPLHAYEVLNGPSQLIQYKASKAYEGYTLFTPPGNITYLIDMLGNVVHSWDHGSFDPGLHCILLENGHLFGGYRLGPKDVKNKAFLIGGWTGGLRELDWDGNEVWRFELNTDKEILHHDFVRLPNGNVLANGWEHIPYDEAIKGGRRADQTQEKVGVVGDIIVEINPAGKVVWKWSAWDHRGTKTKAGLDVNYINYLLPEYKHDNQDWTHFNDVDYDPATDRILTDSREFGELYIIDHKTGDIVYRWGNPAVYGAGNPPTFSTPGDQKLFGPHDTHFIKPGLPGAGNILIFDNGWGRPPITYSSIVEMDPKTGRIIWDYKSKAETGFAAHHISGSQRLPNGNTFICSGNWGHLFEVTPDGEPVWEYIIPVTFSGPKAWIEDAVFPPVKEPEANTTFRAHRYGPDYPGLAEKKLTPKGQIVENIKDGWKPKVDLTGATQPGVKMWKKIWK